MMHLTLKIQKKIELLLNKKKKLNYYKKDLKIYSRKTKIYKIKFKN